MATVTIDIEPMPCPRPRVRVAGKFAHAYYPAAYKNWKEEAARQIRNAAIPTFTGPLAVSIHVRCTKPKTSKLAYPKPDVDNYAKSILDAATSAGLWADDSQVVDLDVFKRWRRGNEPRVLIVIRDFNS